VFVNLLEKQQSPTPDHCHAGIAVLLRLQTVDGMFYFNNSMFHGSTLSGSALLYINAIRLVAKGLPENNLLKFAVFVTFVKSVIKSA
jgi:hypothetical protein